MGHVELADFPLEAIAEHASFVEAV